MSSRPRPHHELAQLKDEELIRQAISARDAGDSESFRQAIDEFTTRRMSLVEYWVSQKSDGDETEDILAEALLSIAKGIRSFKGSSVGELVEWMRTITSRRIADHYRAREKQLRTTPLVDQPSEDDPGEVAGKPESTDASNLRMLIEDLLSELDPAHRKAVELRIAGYSSKETAEQCGARMTPANVDQIFSRFRKKLAKDLWDD